MGKTIQPPQNQFTNPAFTNLDGNGDGKITAADLKGLNAAQIQGAMVVLSALCDGFSPPDVVSGINGKKVLFTGMGEEAKVKAQRIAKDKGAVISTSLSAKVEMLVVGDRAKTTKDEKAILMNATGQAKIRLLTLQDFERLTASQDAPALLLGNDKGNGKRVVMSREHTTNDNQTFTDSYSVSQSLLNKVNNALRDFLRETFYDTDSFPSKVEFDELLASVAVDGWLVQNDSYDPFDSDLNQYFVFTAYAENISGDHGLYVFLDRQTGKISEVQAFN